MGRLAIQRIERWFADHDDGDFAANGRCLAYSVIGPVNGHSRILYTTKTDTVRAALGRSALLRRFSMIARYGLPSRQDLRWIKEMVGRRRLFFVGDADPADLMIFRWLQILLGQRKILHLGVNDGLLRSSTIKIQKSFTIRLSRSERERLRCSTKCFPITGTSSARIAREFSSKTEKSKPRCSSVFRARRTRFSIMSWTIIDAVCGFFPRSAVLRFSLMPKVWRCPKLE